MEKINKEYRNKKNSIVNALLLVISIILIAIIILGFLNGEKLSINDLKGITINYSFLIACLLLMVSFIILDSYKFYRLIYNFSKNKNFKLGYLTATYGKYYASITPAGCGEQAFEIYYLHKNGLSNHSSVSAPMCKLIFNYLALLLFFLFSFIFNILNKTSMINSNIFILGIVAFFINLFLVSMIFIASLKKELALKVVKFFFRVLSKIKLIKDYENKCLQFETTLNDYQSNIKAISSNLKESLTQVILAL